MREFKEQIIKKALGYVPTLNTVIFKMNIIFFTMKSRYDTPDNKTGNHQTNKSWYSHRKKEVEIKCRPSKQGK